MENPMSFWRLIGRFKIEIPVIQRDYAQGRDNPRAIDVRKKIVKKIVDSLIDSNKDEFFDRLTTIGGKRNAISHLTEKYGNGHE